MSLADKPSCAFKTISKKAFGFSKFSESTLSIRTNARFLLTWWIHNRVPSMPCRCVVSTKPGARCDRAWLKEAIGTCGGRCAPHFRLAWQAPQVFEKQSILLNCWKATLLLNGLA
jgi:hypothetical protein